MSTIELKPLSPKWNKAFEDFSKLLRSAPNAVFMDVVHIGSTAIDEAPTKDVVDIQCAIRSFDNMDLVKAVLEPLGFTYSESFTQDHAPFHAQDYKNSAWEKRFFSGYYQDQKFHVHIRLHDSLNMKFAYTIIYVEDVENTLHFYKKAFCLAQGFLHESKQYGELDTGNTKLAFASNALAESNGVGFVKNHIVNRAAGFEIAFVSDDVKQAYQHALANGAHSVKEPTTKPWGQEVAYVRDLNGIIIEICSPMG